MSSFSLVSVSFRLVARAFCSILTRSFACFEYFSCSVGVTLGEATDALTKAGEAYQKAKKDIGEMKGLHLVS